MTRPTRTMRLSTVIALLEDAREEMFELEQYEHNEEAIYSIKDPDERKAEWRKHYDHWAGHVPRQQHINDNLKVARRLLLDIYK